MSKKPDTISFWWVLLALIDGIGIGVALKGALE